MSQQFCLKWNNHTTNMLQVFESLLSTEALVDVTLACDGLSLKAHKMVLSACSPFFQSLFLENPCKHPIVIMKDMRYCDLKAIIDFMYRGEVNVSHDQLSALLKTAETLKVKGLAEVTGENKNASGIVQQEIIQQSAVSTPTPAPLTPTAQRTDTPPLQGKRKRGRPRKRSLSDSNRSDDEGVSSKIKSRDSDIEELSGDASLDATSDIRSGGGPGSSNSQSQVPSQHSSNNVNSFSKSHLSISQDSQVDDTASGDENEFEVEPSKLLEQTLTTDNVPSSSQNSTGHIQLPAVSGLEISRRSMSSTDSLSQALVPVSDSLGSNLQAPDSPQDIKPQILSFDDPPISPVAGPSHSSERSMMMYMDQSGVSSIPGPSNYQDNSALVPHDSQPQASKLDEDNNVDILSDERVASSKIQTSVCSAYVDLGFDWLKPLIEANILGKVTNEFLKSNPFSALKTGPSRYGANERESTVFVNKETSGHKIKFHSCRKKFNMPKKLHSKNLKKIKFCDVCKKDVKSLKKHFYRNHSINICNDSHSLSFANSTNNGYNKISMESSSSKLHALHSIDQNPLVSTQSQEFESSSGTFEESVDNMTRYTNSSNGTIANVQIDLTDSDTDILDQSNGFENETSTFMKEHKSFSQIKEIGQNVISNINENLVSNNVCSTSVQENISAEMSKQSVLSTNSKSPTAVQNYNKNSLGDYQYTSVKKRRGRPLKKSTKSIRNIERFSQNKETCHNVISNINKNANLLSDDVCSLIAQENVSATGMPEQSVLSNNSKPTSVHLQSTSLKRRCRCFFKKSRKSPRNIPNVNTSASPIMDESVVSPSIGRPIKKSTKSIRNIESFSQSKETCHNVISNINKKANLLSDDICSLIAQENVSALGMSEQSVLSNNSKPTSVHLQSTSLKRRRRGFFKKSRKSPRNIPNVNTSASHITNETVVSPSNDLLPTTLNEQGQGAKKSEHFESIDSNLRVNSSSVTNYTLVESTEKCPQSDPAINCEIVAALDYNQFPEESEPISNEKHDHFPNEAKEWNSVIFNLLNNTSSQFCETLQQPCEANNSEIAASSDYSNSLDMTTSLNESSFFT